MSSLITLDANAVTEIAAIQSKVLAIGERFALLTIEGPEDKAGFDRVHDARMEARDLRLDVQKRHETAKKAALEFGRKLDEAKRNIVGLIEPIEADLQAKEDAYKEAKEAIKRKEADAKAAKLQARVDALGAVGGAVSIAVLQAITDEQFAAELTKATLVHEELKAAEEVASVERERQEAEARKLREAEETRIAAERTKLEADRKAQEELARIERQKLEDERRQQAEAQRKIDAENNRLAAERQRIEREEFERQAKATAEKEAREKVERERVEQERLAKEKAEREAEEARRREAMKPDLERLRDYVAAIEAVPIPEVQDPSAKERLLQFVGHIERECRFLEVWMDA